jgi:hypothetical protein
MLSASSGVPRSLQKTNSERRVVDSCCKARSSLGGMSIARRERLDLGVPSVPCQSDRRM